MKFKRVNDSNNNINIEISEFSRQKGAAEYHIVLTPVFNGTIEEQLSAIARAYYSLLIDENIDKETIVFKKFFVSDLINQMKILESNPFSSGSSKNILCCISYIGQPPCLIIKSACGFTMLEAKKIQGRSKKIWLPILY
jgi:hypothetical protein